MGDTNRKRRRRARRARRLGRTRGRRSDLVAARELNDALRRLAPSLQRVVSDALENAGNVVARRDTVRLLEAGRTAEAVVTAQEAAAVSARLRGRGLPPGRKSAIDLVAETLLEGGAAGQRIMPRNIGSLVGNLDLTNPEAVRFLQQTLPERIRLIDNQSRDSIRQSILRGVQEGRPPRVIARDIRDVAGLTPTMESWVDNLREQLETGRVGGSTPPWDRRISAAEAQRARRLFREEQPSRRQLDALVSRYAASLRNRRALNIARTETHRALIEGQKAIWSQAVDEGLLDPAEARQVWVVTPDERLREQHAAVPGMNPEGIPLGGMFETPIGPVAGPGQSGDPGFDIDCRCTVALEFVDA